MVAFIKNEKALHNFERPLKCFLHLKYKLECYQKNELLIPKAYRICTAR